MAASVPITIACTCTSARLAQATDQYWEDDFSLESVSSRLANVDNREASVISKFPCFRENEIKEIQKEDRVIQYYQKMSSLVSRFRQHFECIDNFWLAYL